jgi:hypothetical protein
MINSDDVATANDGGEAIEDAVARAPVGAATIAGLATTVVVGIWIAFYLFVFVPRGAPLP